MCRATAATRRASARPKEGDIRGPGDKGGLGERGGIWAEITDPAIHLLFGPYQLSKARKLTSPHVKPIRIIRRQLLLRSSLDRIHPCWNLELTRPFQVGAVGFDECLGTVDERSESKQRVIL